MRFRNTVALFTALLAFAGFGQSAQASLIGYRIDCTVEYFLNDTISRPNPAVAIGNVYYGFFAIDDSILTTDGLNKPGDVFAFFTKIVNAIWSSNFPSPISLFEGYRGPDNSISPGFDVVGGEIVNLRGGVVGPGDAFFIDFSSNARPGSPALLPATHPRWMHK